MFSRKIIHLDMDAFYASVEQRDNPNLIGKPVIVGGTPDGRGVVAAASYESREFGIHSAMSAAKAKQLCPHAIFITPRIQIYKRISRMIMGLLREYTELVEPLALDEAYMDVTVNKRALPYATAVAKNIRERIHETSGLTASAGVAPNKFLAKVASKRAKPNGMCVITPEEVEQFVPKLAVREVPGIGPKMESKMYNMGIETLAHLQEFSESQLVGLFGTKGSWYYDVARGVDHRSVNPERERKSVGVERTYNEDIRSKVEALERLSSLSQELEKRLRKNNMAGKTLTLKVTYSDFKKSTRAVTKETPFLLKQDIQAEVEEQLAHTEIGIKPARLLGVSVSNMVPILEGLGKPSGEQLSLMP